MKKLCCCFLTVPLIFILSLPLYAQPGGELCEEKAQTECSLDNSVIKYLKDERYSSDQARGKRFSVIDLFKSKAFAATKNVDEDRKKLREEWKEFLGLDVFYPYFKANEIENYVKEKTKVRLFNMHGGTEFSRDSKEIKYIFKRNF